MGTRVTLLQTARRSDPAHPSWGCLALVLYSVVLRTTIQSAPLSKFSTQTSDTSVGLKRKSITAIE
jgi:hypothetical protein